MLKVSTSKIIATGKHSGKNLGGLRVGGGQYGLTGLVSKSVASKYRTILTNWFEVNAKYVSDGKKGKAQKPMTPTKQRSKSKEIKKVKNKTSVSSSLRSLECDKIYFQTLTFSGQPTEKQAKESLKKYLAFLRLNGCSHFFWCMERSGVIGDNIHFHLLVDLNKDLLTLCSDKWNRINKTDSPYSLKSTLVYNWRGIVAYVLKGFEHGKETRQFGISRSLSDFRAIELRGVDADLYNEQNGNQMKLIFAHRYFKIMQPTPRLKAKIINLYLIKYLVRKSEILAIRNEWRTEQKRN